MRRPLWTLARAAALAGGLAFAAGPAQALTLGFGCITGNQASDCAIGEAQLGVEVADEGGGNVSFHFSNAGPEASAISEIYFDDGSLLELSGVTNGSGVDFVHDANPPNLPGGGDLSPPFVATEGFKAESTPPPPGNGVGPGEWVRIDFELQNGQTFADVEDDLASGDLRIGLHVIGFDSGESEGFVNQVPEPAAGFLLTAAAAALACRRRAAGSWRARHGAAHRRTRA